MISINNNMSWHDHVATIAKTASQKLGVFFRCRKLYTPEQLLLLYKAQIRPSLGYCSHVWGCAPKHSLKLLDSIQYRAVKLIDTDNLTKDLHSLEHRRRIIAPKAVRTRNTKDALHAHPYQVEVPTPRTSLLQHSCFWKASTLWNELPRNEEKLFGIEENTNDADIYMTQEYLIWEEFASVATNLLEKIEYFLDTFDQINLDEKNETNTKQTKDSSTNLSFTAW
nr:unnamed protein product [Callosobruchus analis]